YDVPVIGYENETVNTLRLWSAEPVSGAPDNSGDQEEFYHHLDFEHSIEQLSGFLYPDDSSYEGKELRLKQQYFLVSASVQNMIKQFKKNYRLSSKHFPEKIVIQINDTHPSLSIPELMR